MTFFNYAEKCSWVIFFFFKHFENYFHQALDMKIEDHQAKKTFLKKKKIRKQNQITLISLVWSCGDIGCANHESSDHKHWSQPT